MMVILWHLRLSACVACAPLLACLPQTAAVLPSGRPCVSASFPPDQDTAHVGLGSATRSSHDTLQVRGDDSHGRVDALDQSRTANSRATGGSDEVNV